MPVSPTDPIVTLAASNTGLPPAVVAAQINEESGGNPRAVSPAGAEGEFQFLPSTYTGLGFPAGTEFDPSVEVRAYEKYMVELLQWAKGDVRQALAAYNAGQGNWQAGLGYADTILSNAHEGTGFTVGTHQQPTTVGVGGMNIGGIVGDLTSLISLPAAWAKDILGAPSAIAQAVLVLASPFRTLAEVLDWMLHPAHWIRIFAGLAGGALVLMGIWTLTHVGGGEAA